MNFSAVCANFNIYANYSVLQYYMCIFNKIFIHNIQKAEYQKFSDKSQ